MSGYLLLKHLHVTCVALSGLGFLLRAWWVWRASPLALRRLTRVIPHIVDTVLLTSAVIMAWWSGQYPFGQQWLTAKFFGLLLYIVAGSYALKRARTCRGRAIALLVAILAFAYIVTVALTRNPWPGLVSG